MSTTSAYHPWLLSPQPPSNSTITKIISTTNLNNRLSPQLNLTTFNTLLLSTPSRCTRLASSTIAAAGRSSINPKQTEKEEEVEEVEEDLPWIQEKALDIVEFSGSVTQALPGPRVGRSSLPWILAVPLAYVGISFVIAVVKTVRKFTSPKQARRRLTFLSWKYIIWLANHKRIPAEAMKACLEVSKNAELCRSIDKLLEKEKNGVQHEVLKELMQKTGFSMVDILRKYIRYALNEKPFDPKLVAALIQLRKASLLDDSQVAEVLNEISRRIVKDFGPVVLNTSGYSEKGLRRKLAVQALFGKILYLSELPEFCARDSSLIVKEIFGVADEDAEKLRLHTVAEDGDMESLEKMVVGVDSDQDLDSEDSGEDS